MIDVTTTSIYEDYKTMIYFLERKRDEVRVRIHLASMEVTEEWEVVEKKWEHMRAKGEKLKNASGESAKDIGEAVNALGREIGESYKRLLLVL